MGPKANNKEEIDGMIQCAASAAVEAVSAQLRDDFTPRYEYTCAIESESGYQWLEQQWAKRFCRLSSHCLRPNL